jgi:hypothetical protein
MKIQFVIIFLLYTCLFVSTNKISAQDSKLLIDKPGTTKIENNGVYGEGLDSYNQKCVYTKLEADANYKKLVGLIDIFRINPVLAEQKGYDGIVLLSNGRCNSRFGYGIPCTMCFMFEGWSLRNGKVAKQTSEPPQWRFEVNMTEKFCSNGFNMTNYSNTYNPTNSAFSEEGMDKATFALREIFYLPGIKKEVSLGIDRYSDQVVIFNPDRPAYWVQVTIREVFRMMMDYWKLIPNKIEMETMMPILGKEFSRFSETEKDGFAYFGNPESISRIGSTKNETPVMRPNPEYWNRKLPRSAIQFMVLEIPPKEVVKSKMDDRWKRQDGYYYVSRLLYELDVNTLVPAIEK